MNRQSDIPIGTCAWSYDDWRGVFYPDHLPAAKWLEYYARYLPAVEVDSTFYHIPTPHVAEHWHAVTPAHFRFSCKLPREITHERKLRDAAEPLGEFLRGVEPLGEKLACVLVQLPPFFTPQHDASALRDFIRALPAGVRFAMEFRHAGWHLPRIVHLLEEHGVCWVWSDTTAMEAQREGAFAFLPDTTDWVYVRLLGDLAREYDRAGRRIHRYRELKWARDPGLESWATRIRQVKESNRGVFIAVSNHYEGFAPESCRRLAERLGLNITLPVLGSVESEGAAVDPQMELL